MASSGLPVTFTAGPRRVCTSGGTNGAAITLTGIGFCTVIASQPGNGQYLSAPPVRLYKRGLEGLTWARLVEHSERTAGLERVNRVHPPA